MQIEQIDWDAAERFFPTHLWKQAARDDIAAAFAAHRLAAQPPEGMVLVPQAALDWLYGVGPDSDGYHFGEEAAPRGDGAFWWRPKFRAMIAAHTGQQP